MKDKATAARGYSPALISIILIAFCIRMAYVWFSRTDVLSRNLIVDAKFYDDWAQRIVRGDWLGTAVFVQDPLYAYFLAVCYRVFGHSIEFVRLVQAALDTGTVALLYFIGRRLFNVRAGLIAAAVGALYGPMVFYTGLLEKTTFAIFLITLALAMLVQGGVTGLHRWLFMSGICCGLAALTRGNMAIVALFLSLWLICKKGLTPSSVLGGAIFFMGAATPLIACMARNYYVSRDIVPISSNAGLNLLIGNNQFSDGNYIEPPFIHGVPEMEFSDSKAFAERALGKTLTKASEVSRFYMKQALSFIIHSPRRWFRLLGKKLFLAFNGFEITETYGFYYFLEKYWILRLAFLTFRIIGPIGLAGVILSLARSRNNELHVLLGAYVFSLLLFFVTGRYRMPIVIPLILFSGNLLGTSIEQLKARRLPKSIMAIMATAVICNLTPHWMTDIARSGLETPHALAGYVYCTSEKDFDHALSELKTAKFLYPEATGWRMTLAGCYLKMGAVDEALANYEDILGIGPSEDVFAQVGGIYLGRRDFARAIDAFENALRLNPGNPLYQEGLRRARNALQ